jgi:hypothetical protein
VTAREKLFTLRFFSSCNRISFCKKQREESFRALFHKKQALVQILADCRGKVISQYRFYTPGEQSAAYYSGHRARGILFYARSVA